MRLLAPLAKARRRHPWAVIVDSRTLQSSPESGARASDDGATRRKVHLVGDTLGHLLMLLVTPANEQDRAQVGPLVGQVWALTGEKVELAYADQGDTRDEPAQKATRGFVLIPCRWVVERSFAWMARFRCLARDHERLPETLAGLTFV